MIAWSSHLHPRRMRVISLLVVFSLLITVAPVIGSVSAGPPDGPDWTGKPAPAEGRFEVIDPAPPAPEWGLPSTARAADGPAEADSVIVRFRDDVRPGTVGRARSHERSGGRAARALRFAHDFEVVEVPVGLTADELVARYAEEPDVLYAEPNAEVQLASAPAPDDTYFNRQWALRNEGQHGGLAGADIGILEAWQATQGSDEVVVAVIDTGVDYTHEDLASRMWSGLGYDFYSGDNDPMDVHGHGTHVASTIAAAGGDGFGVAGVAPGVRIMALKVFDDTGNGATIAGIVNAFGFAEANGADVVNASWVVSTEYISLRDAVSGSSALVVAAAGNFGENSDIVPRYPAAWNHDNILAVAATDRFDQLAGFSNYGVGTIDIAAPGVEILGAVPGRETVHFYDDFSDMDAWVAQYSRTNDWGLSAEHFTSSPSALADSPGGSYANNEDSFVRTRDPIDLSGAPDARLEFQMWLQTQEGFDGVVAFAHDGGSDWQYLGSWSGSTAEEFARIQVDLAAYIGKQVRIGFLFVSDESVTGRGAYIDDLRVVSTAPAGPSNKHAYKNGTSMAAPHAAGVAALLFSSAPELTAAEAKQVLRRSAATVPALDDKVATGARLDTRILFTAPPPVTGLASPSHGDTSSWTAEADVEFVWDAVEHPVGIRGYPSGVFSEPDIEPVDSVTGTTGAWFLDVPSGEWHFAVRARTMAGAMGPVTRTAVRIDTTPPITLSDAVASYDDSATITLTASDEHSGVVATYYSIDGGPTQPYTGPLVFDEPEVTQALEFWSADNVGNVEPTQTVTFAIDDTIPPVSEIALDPAEPDGAFGWYRTPPHITITRDDAGSGVDYTEWRFEGEAEPTRGTEVTGFGDGEHTLYYRSVDYAGNVEETRTVEFKADSAPPDVWHTGAGVFADPATLTIQAGDETSGVREIFWTGDRSGSAPGDAVSLNFADPGTYSIVYWATDWAGNTSPMGSATVTVRATDVGRLWGQDRYGTSVAIAREAYPRFAGVEYVVVASGEDRAAADPLAAAGLAGVLDAPLLLVHSGGVPDSVRSAIASMPDEVTVIVIGGTVAVPRSVGLELSGMRRVEQVQRVEGADRYATARAIAARMRTELERQGKPMPDTALLANGADPRAFFDALALSAVSAKNHFPVLLLESDRVPAATSAALSEQGLTRRIIGGGPAVVSERVRTQLGAERWAGADRYSTSVVIASRATAAGYSTYGTTAVSASLPDALTGGAMAGSRGGVLLLTQRDRLTPVTETAVRVNRDRITHLYLLGGSASVTESVRTRIRSLLK